jgi:hypothetical protein
VNIQDGFADSDVGAEMTCVGAGSVDRHDLGAEAVSGRISELVELVEVASKCGVVGELSGTQGALMDVWEMRLYVEGLLKGVVGPVDAVGTGVAAARSEGLGLVHAPDRRDG